ncbi:MAG: ABC transporter permease [Candidatus Omnitrophica bacterium]|jgi:macrolide transport system ATP-binding/permease protein|nr:ABC transporter permease [Candidatus Omnitrophota bacterium]MDD5518331.1 ABC transporter permease [Candidatus Omnitrophota bacterium]
MIEVKNLSKTYQMGDVKVEALRGVSLKISSGEFVAIMGASGSGKSTLMHVLGLLDRPDSGQYYLGGEEVTKLSDKELALVRNQLVGFVFQQFHLLPRMTALENAELPLIYAGKRHLKERAAKEIEGVGLKDRMLHRPNEMSGGQQQRVAIARSLVNDPPLIFADEPTGNLDSKSKEEIMAILKKLNQAGKTVIVVTHESDIASQARRIIQMRDGEVISDKVVCAEAKPSASGIPEDLIKNILTESNKGIKGGIEFLDYLRQAISAMLAHKMRAFLSILGILIGVAAVIAMLAIGQGAKESIEKQLASLGSNLLIVRPGAHRSGGVALQTGVTTRFTFQDVAAIKKLSEYVDRVSPSVSDRAQIVYGNKNWNTQVEGVGVDYAQLRSAVPTVGRFFTEEEVRLRNKVVLLGTTVAREIFGEVNPIGETIKINLINFKVIGILPAKGAGGFRDQDDTVVIPVTTAMYRVLGKEYIDYIYVEAKSADLTEVAQEAVSKLIIKQHRLISNDQKDSFQIFNMADIKNTLTSTTETMSLLLGAIAAISLLVGGIGIMNIMLVSVTERTREIGLRKAIGANNKDIMVQFLIEAVLMSLIGGLAGVLLGSGAATLITVFAKWSVRVSLFSIILATVFSLIVGIVFGIWPARKAAKLDPIEALRYE